MVQQKLFSFNIIEKDHQEVSPRGGLILFDGFLKSLKVDEIIRRNMPLPGSNRGYGAWRYIEPLILMQYGGGRKISDLKELREDKVLQRATGISCIPSDSAAGDWLLRTGENGGIDALKKSQEEISKKLLKMDNKEAYTMYVDPTIIDLGYKSDAQMTYTGVKGDRPILVGLKEFPIFVHADYRQGNAMGGIVKAVESAYEVVESAGKKVKHFSGDSECYVGDLFNFLRQKGATFTIVADQDVAVQETIRAIPKDEWKPYIDRHGIKTDREIAVSVHSMNKTEAFTLIVLRWKEKTKQLSLFKSDGYYYHAIATDLDIDPQRVIDVHGEKASEACTGVWKYNERVQMENFIKELKIGIGMEHMPCGKFEANAMYFGIGVITYNLMVAQKYFVIKEGYENKTIQTLRWKLIQVPARIIKTGRYIILKLETVADKFNHYLAMIRRIESIAALIV